MKLLAKRLFNTKSFIFLRNFFNFRPIPNDIHKEYRGSISMSDAFLWRTDHSFSTIFKYSDILKLFYKDKNSSVELLFYSKSNELLKTLIIKDIDLGNELIIDKFFFDGLEDYGVFYVYHRSDLVNTEPLIISNRCYVGFSKSNSLFSFVHGNINVRYKNLTGGNQFIDIVKTSFLSNNLYKIQNFFEEFTSTELFFTNPTSKSINIKIGNDSYVLKKGCSILVDLKKIKETSIVSNCLFLRPLIFNYKNNFFDVYHG